MTGKKIKKTSILSILILLVLVTKSEIVYCQSGQDETLKALNNCDANYELVSGFLVECTKSDSIKSVQINNYANKISVLNEINANKNKEIQLLNKEITVYQKAKNRRFVYFASGLISGILLIKLL